MASWTVVIAYLMACHGADAERDVASRGTALEPSHELQNFSGRPARSAGQFAQDDALADASSLVETKAVCVCTKSALQPYKDLRHEIFQKTVRLVDTNETLSGIGGTIEDNSGAAVAEEDGDGGEVQEVIWNIFQDSERSPDYDYVDGLENLMTAGGCSILPGGSAEKVQAVRPNKFKQGPQLSWPKHFKITAPGALDAIRIFWCLLGRETAGNNKLQHFLGQSEGLDWLEVWYEPNSESFLTAEDLQKLEAIFIDVIKTGEQDFIARQEWEEYKKQKAQSAKLDSQLDAFEFELNKIERKGMKLARLG